MPVADEMDRRLMSKLGDFSLVKKHILDTDMNSINSTRFIGISTSAAAAQRQPQSRPPANGGSSSGNKGAPYYYNQPLPPPARTFPKTADVNVNANKTLNYNGRSGYPTQSQPIKHDAPSSMPHPGISKVPPPTAGPPQLMNGRPNPPALTNGRVPTFAKPAKPEHQPNILAPSTPSSGGGDIDRILKMMTSLVDPLSGIAATPRNEIAELHPPKQHKYAEMPPLFKPPIKPREYNLI